MSSAPIASNCCNSSVVVSSGVRVTRQALSQGLWTGLIGLSGAFQLSPALHPSAQTVAALRFAAVFFPKLPIRRPFDPRFIVSDAAALRSWEEDPLVSRGKLTLGHILELQRASAGLQSMLQGLRVPVLMLWGTGDQVVLEEGHKIMMEASGHKASELIKYPGGFHNLLAEPGLKDFVMLDIERWVRKVSRGSPHKG
mmetsp:Transcript_20559/g.71144  ORF Transcript_20559/g.71144 Transcript_20559/m.71144 type:complete len:197 (+) Transcript_20559:804-1394(+)